MESPSQPPQHRNLGGTGLGPWFVIRLRRLGGGLENELPEVCQTKNCPARRVAKSPMFSGVSCAFSRRPIRRKPRWPPVWRTRGFGAELPVKGAARRGEATPSALLAPAPISHSGCRHGTYWRNVCLGSGQFVSGFGTVRRDETECRIRKSGRTGNSPTKSVEWPVASVGRRGTRRRRRRWLMAGGGTASRTACAGGASRPLEKSFRL